MATSEMPSDVLFSTAYHFEFLMFLVFLLIGFILFFLYYFVKNHAFRNLETFLFYAKTIVFTVILIFVLIALIDSFIIVEITEGAKYASIIIVLVVSLLMGVYINVTFSSIFESKSRLTRYTMLFIVLYIAISNFGDLGVRLVLNTDVYIPLVLANKVFESNTPNGIRFIFSNLATLLVIYGVSFLLESKSNPGSD